MAVVLFSAKRGDKTGNRLVDFDGGNSFLKEKLFHLHV
jgi:hypothetical protein